jgi:endo-1,4-beta-mannosidase
MSFSRVVLCCSFLASISFPAPGQAAAPDSPAASGSAPAGELAALKIEGNQITAAGRPIRLRGINWGWWHLQGTVYSEADMQRVARWGANVIRLAFSDSDLESDGPTAAFKPEGFAQLDEVIQWARRYGVYVILDMHVVPGGQSTQPYTDHGRNSLWSDATAQDRFNALWAELARRYRDRPEVAAYDLLNEPDSTKKAPELLRAIDERVIKAIRAVDPNKIIVVGADRGSLPWGLVDGMKLPDANILYTFHWYVGTSSDRTPIALEPAAFAAKMSPAIDFAHKFNVPVWVGEFGCQAVDPKYQAQWVATSIAVFETEGFDWTYWNDKEVGSSEGMGLQPENKDGTDKAINETLLSVLRAGWARNIPQK